jgi:peroxiredoxin family protein
VSAPQPEALAAYQRQRSAQRRNAVIAAIGKLDRAAEPVTVAGVAALAGVDRSYIYSQSDLLAEIRRRRTAEPVKLARRPAADRATIASLQARLASAHDEIARLKAENRAIRERLAIALGEAWESELTATRRR